METGKKILSFFAVAEAIAFLISLIPFLIILAQQRQDPTNIKYVIDFFELLPWFLLGQSLGMVISAYLHGFFGRRY